jgi:hypothetical protein
LNSKAAIQPSRFRRLAAALGLVASLALNVALAAWLFRPGPTTAGAGLGVTQTTHSDATKGASAALTDSPLAAVTANSTNSPPPFRWSEIESDDYRRYIANLRAVGCPEQTIRDLIAADLTQLFAPRAAAIWQRKTLQYWQKYERVEPTPSQFKALKALAGEQGAVFKQLLGVPFSQQDQIDLVFLQNSDESTLFLGEDKREAAQRVLDEAGQHDKEMELLSRGSYSQEDRDKLFKEKLKLMAQVLSPEEVEEFRLRNSPTAEVLRSELRYFDSTPEEFKRLLEAREQSGGKVVTGDLINRGPATEQVRQLLGEERAKEFEKTTDMYYQSARNGLELTEQLVELADGAWEISREARAAAERLARDSSLSVEARKQQLRALRAESNRRLNELLGEKAARGVRQNLGVALEVTEANVKP